ncbi:hypothetical protein BN946_scf184996.g44 [Trametes cinnabarina]|uniref:Clp1-like protein n=1 Tax=Pycnoporus cinnabarinus TaxID=5643 RepID=A0A060S8A3_PYCCI|nr:hypothetical protein BN946_scf184996.g44 [Trametes cinnabarina]
MFQVASRPAHHHGAIPEPLNLMSSHYQNSSVAQKLNIPRRLARPAFAEPSRDALARVDPSLANVPFEYIRKMLAGNANQMLTAVSLLTIPNALPCAHLPPTLDAPIRPSSHAPDVSAFPTHVLAILSSRSSATTPTMASFADRSSLPASTTVPLYPASALVLAAHCALLPPLPQGLPPTGRRAALTLPIIPLTIPSPESFPLLHAYLHTMRPDTLLASLLPALASSLPQMPNASSSAGSNRSVYVAQFSADRLVRLAHTLAGAALQRGGSQNTAIGVLMAHVKAVNGLWQNACALGVFDAELWGVMDLAWEVILAAMTKISEGR